MKTIQKEVYISDDGKEFISKDECRLHEELGVISILIKDDSSYYGNALHGNSHELSIIVKDILEIILEKRENEDVVFLEKM